MIPVPAALTAAYGRVPWSPRTLATFLDPSGNVVGDVPVTAGTLTRTEDGYPRSTCDLDLPTATTPAATAPPVTAYGGRVALRVVIDVPGDTFTIPLGTLDIVETSVSRPEGLIRVRAASREALVADRGYLTPGDTAVPASTLNAAVTAIVRGRIPGVPVRSTVPDTATIPGDTFTYGSDPWSLVESLCDTHDAEAFFDAFGTLTIRPVPGAVSTPAVTWSVGAGGTVLAYESVRGWVPNRYRTRFRTDPLAGGTPLVGIGVYDVTAGPLAYTGGYGEHVGWTDDVTISKIPPQARMDALTRARGRRMLAGMRSTTLNVVPCPWVEPGDTATVVLLGDMVERHIVASTTLDLTMLSDMTVTTRDPDYAG